jgi:hypothetical protein
MIPLRVLFAGVVMLAGTTPGVGAELYKWVDERGITNYSNEPPPKGTNAKAVTLPEDRLSVYTPEESVTREIERAKERFARPREPLPNAPRMAEPDRRVLVPPPPPPPGYDPCANPGDLNCQASLYDRSPVFQGRRSPPVLVQPQLPPGTIAGQATLGGGTVPGLSASAPSSLPADRPITLSPPVRDMAGERGTSRR